MGGKKIEIFLSYCQEDKKVVDEVHNILLRYPQINLHMSKNRRLGESKKKNMQTITQMDYIIPFISETYLKTFECMYEVLEIMRDKNYMDKIFPVVIYPGIYDVVIRVDFVEYWQHEFSKLEKASCRIERKNLGSLIGDLREHQNIAADLADFLGTVSDMDTPQVNEISDTIEKWLIEKKIIGDKNDSFESEETNLVKKQNYLKYRDKLYEQYDKQAKFWEGIFPEHKFLSEKGEYFPRVFRQISSEQDVTEEKLNEQISKGENKIFYILGEGGLGKSAYMRKLVCDLREEKMIFPIYIELRDSIKTDKNGIYSDKIIDRFVHIVEHSDKIYKSLEFNKLLYNEVKNNNDLKIAWKRIDEILPGRIVLLLDAKNEIEKESARTAFFYELEIICSECQNCSIVITSRTKSDLQKMQKNIEEYELLPFGEDIISEMLDKKNKECSEELLASLNNPICLFMYLYTPKWSHVSILYRDNIKNKADIYWNYFHSELFTKLDSMNIYPDEFYEGYFLIDYLIPYLAGEFHYISFDDSELNNALEEFYYITKGIESKLEEDRIGIPIKKEEDPLAPNIEKIICGNQSEFKNKWRTKLENNSFLIEKYYDSTKKRYRFLHESFCEFMQALQIWDSVDVFQFYGIQKKMAFRGEKPSECLWKYMNPRLTDYDDYNVEKFYQDLIFTQNLGENDREEVCDCVRKSLFLKNVFNIINESSCQPLWKKRACNIIYDIYESYLLSLKKEDTFYDEIVSICEENLVKILPMVQETGDFNLLSSFARKFRDGFIIRTYSNKTQMDLNQCMELANEAIELYSKESAYEGEFRGYNQKAKCFNAELENAINWYVKNTNEGNYTPLLQFKYLYIDYIELLVYPEFKALKEKLYGDKNKLKKSEMILYCKFLHNTVMYWLDKSIECQSSESASLKALISEMIIEGIGETNKFNYEEVYKNYEFASKGKVKAYAICKCTQLIGEEKVKERNWDEEQFLCAYRTGLWMGKYVWGLYQEKNKNFKEAYIAYSQAGDRFPPLIKKLRLMLENNFDIAQKEEVIEKIIKIISRMQDKEIKYYQRDIWYANSKIIREYYDRVLKIIEPYKEKIKEYEILKNHIESERSKPSNFNFWDYYFYLDELI